MRTKYSLHRNRLGWWGPLVPCFTAVKTYAHWCTPTAWFEFQATADFTLLWCCDVWLNFLNVVEKVGAAVLNSIWRMDGKDGWAVLGWSSSRNWHSFLRGEWTSEILLLHLRFAVVCWRILSRQSFSKWRCLEKSNVLQEDVMIMIRSCDPLNIPYSLFQLFSEGIHPSRSVL